jgi:hypothetical protein
MPGTAALHSMLTDIGGTVCHVEAAESRCQERNAVKEDRAHTRDRNVRKDRQENQFQRFLISEDCFHYAAVYPQCGAVGGRRKFTSQVGHHRRNFIHGGKALQ